MNRCSLTVPVILPLLQSALQRQPKLTCPNPKCWYQPAALPEEASLALRWTLSRPITAAVAPGDEKYFRLAMDVAQSFKPLKGGEEKALMARAQGVEPLFKLGNA